MEASQTSVWVLVGTSAAIGALVSSGIAEIGRWRERKSRREELVLSKAIDMAHTRFSNMMTILRDTQQKGNLMPEIEMAEDYHHFLKHMLEKGCLPPDYDRSIKRKWEPPSS